MTKNELLWEARKNVLFSYAHKALLLAVAFLGFWALDWLSKQKEDFEEPNWTVTQDVASVISTATQNPYCVTPKPEKETKKFATLGELTAAMQDRAEACVRQEIRDNVNEARREMAQIRKRDPLTQEWESLTEKELETYTLYANLIAREEAFAELKVRAVRQYIGAMLVGMNRPEDQGNEVGIRRILDENSGGYVIYKILWFASLLLGIGAASMLFIIILTALPITNGEGYWTERIGEILKSLPASASRTIAAPLLTAAVGLGTLAGTVATTEAGGQARFPSEQESSAEDPSPRGGSTGKQPKGPASDDEQTPPGFVYNDYRGPREIELLLTLLMDDPKDPVKLEGIEKELELIRQKAEALVAQAGTAKQEVVAAIEDVTDATRDVEERVVEARKAVDDTNLAAVNILAGVQDLKPVVHQIDQMSHVLSQHVIDETAVSQGIEGREEDQAKTVTQTLAQSAETDSRGFFRRTFGLTLFKVGPAVPKVMAARFDPKTSSKTEMEALQNALQAMRGVDPLNRWKFELLLRTELKKPVGDSMLTSAQIDSLINGHLRSLLRICALPR